MSEADKGLLLTNARVVLRDRVLPASSILIEGGRIVSIGPGESNAKRSTTVQDLHGATLYPGFIDVHIHGSAGFDVMHADERQLSSIASFLASHGVTSWLPTFVPSEDEEYANAAASIAAYAKNASSHGARISGVHYEGPFINAAQCGALHIKHFKSYAGPHDLDRLAVPNGKLVTMITLAPEVSGGAALIAELKKRGWVISIGHTRADLKTLDLAFEVGARHMTHFMNAMPSLHHRNPGPVGWGLSNEQVTFDVIADGIHLEPFMLELIFRIKGPQKMCLISDAIAAAGKGDGEYHIWEETITVNGGRTSNASGNIAGSVITMLDAVRMMGSLDVSEVEIAQMASLNPARLLGLENECGSIEVGKRADLVALDKDGNVRLTMVEGKVVYDSNLHPRQ
jgi:N-acetylglucosamine-6-phosphate deacetylase